MTAGHIALDVVVRTQSVLLLQECNSFAIVSVDGSSKEESNLATRCRSYTLQEDDAESTKRLPKLTRKLHLKNLCG